MDQLVCIISGSRSDDDIVLAAVKILNDLGIKHSRNVCSAHRDPERLKNIVRDADSEGIRVFVCIAGMAAHLPGVVASLTARPVIGVPVGSSKLSGMDSLLSIVQMPRGIPVACVAVDGGANAALLAAQIIATDKEKLALFENLNSRRERDRE